MLHLDFYGDMRISASPTRVSECIGVRTYV